MKSNKIVKKNLAIITTHPQYYQVPIFQIIAEKKIFNLDVYYASDEGAKISKDTEFNKPVKWDIPLLRNHNYLISKNQKRSTTSFFLSFDKLKNFLLKKKYDAILILGWNNIFYLKSFFIGLFAKIPLILRVETNHNRKIFFIKKIIKNLFLFFFLSKFAYFLYIGKRNKKFYQSYNIENNKLFYAPYSVDNEFYFHNNNDLKFFKKKFNPSNKKIILFVGKIIERKNPIAFLELAFFFKDRKDFLFMMVGDGNLKGYCKKYIANNNLKNVLLVGFQNRKEIRAIYKISYILVVPSKYETWGLVVNEAMACKLPAIVSNACGCTDDLIKNKVTGFIYKEGNFADLKKNFLQLMDNRILYLKIKANLIPYIKKQNFNVTINSLQKILNKYRK
jgi:glycosyltransferase involved in cell wall biosynthesis